MIEASLDPLQRNRFSQNQWADILSRGAVLCARTHRAREHKYECSTNTK